MPFALADGILLCAQSAFPWRAKFVFSSIFLCCWWVSYNVENVVAWVSLDSPKSTITKQVSDYREGPTHQSIYSLGFSSLYDAVLTSLSSKNSDLVGLPKNSDGRKNILMPIKNQTDPRAQISTSIKSSASSWYLARKKVIAAWDTNTQENQPHAGLRLLADSNFLWLNDKKTRTSNWMRIIQVIIVVLVSWLVG